MKIQTWAKGVVGAGVLATAFLTQPAAADNWNSLGSSFESQNVRAVAADPNEPLRLAAIANNQLYTTATGGVTWEKTDLGVFLNEVAYDPEVPGRLIVGTTGRCLMIRATPVAAWESYGTNTSDCSVGAMAVAGGQIFFVNQGAATHDIMRLDRGGSVVKTTTYGGRPRAFDLAADPDGRHLYVSSDNDIFRSDDSGDTWQTLPKSDGDTMCRIAGLWASGDTLWALSCGRPAVSYDSGMTWTGRGPRTDYHYYLSALTVYGSTPYFGMISDGNGQPDVVTTASVPMVGLGLGRMPSRIVAAGNRLIVATGSGLWVRDEVLSSPAQLQRPVVVIPGIMGSWPKQFGLFGELVLDPLAHTYDHLVDQLRAAGFNEGNHMLKLFPYQWRQDNQITAQQLAATIASTKVECSCPKVDLVAHSMGGLVARSYIQSDDYRGDVGKLIEIATPNRGSPEAYYMWEGGEFYNDGNLSGYLTNALIQSVMRVEAALKHYLSFIDYLRIKVPSVGQLLPDYSYIAERTYPAGYPHNTYLENLNTAAGVTRLKARVQLYVTGSAAVPTLTGLMVGPVSGNHAWPDGRIISQTLGTGDGTVPYTSLASLDKVSWLTAASHRALVGDSSRAVIKYLLDGEPDAAYLAQVPHQAELQRVADAPAASAPQRETIIYAPETSNAVIRDTSGHVADSSSQTFPGAYWFTDGDGRYLVMPDSSPGQVINVTVSPGQIVPVGIVDISAGEPQQTSEVLTGGTTTTNTATIVIGEPGSSTTQISLPVEVTAVVTVAAQSQSQTPSPSLSPILRSSGSVVSPRGAVLGVEAVVRNTTLPVIKPKLGLAAVTLPSPPPTASKAKTTIVTIGLLGLGATVIIWLLLYRVRRRVADKTSDRA